MSPGEHLSTNLPIVILFVGVTITSLPYIKSIQFGDKFEQQGNAFKQMSHAITQQIKGLEKTKVRLK